MLNDPHIGDVIVNRRGLRLRIVAICQYLPAYEAKPRQRITCQVWYKYRNEMRWSSSGNRRLLDVHWHAWEKEAQPEETPHVPHEDDDV